MSTSSGEIDSDSTATRSDSADRSRGRYVAIAGILLMMGPFFAFLGTFVVFSRMFGDALPSAGGNSTELSPAMELTFRMTMWGYGIGLVGVVLVLIAALVLKNREQWFYQNAIVLAVIWCFLAFPIGTFVGVLLLFALLMRRAEFHNSTRA